MSPRHSRALALVALACAQQDCARLPLGDDFRWLHAPKTGSSFLNVLFRHACPEAPPTMRYTSGRPVWPPDGEMAAFFHATNSCKHSVSVIFDGVHAPAVYPRDAGVLVGLFRADYLPQVEFCLI